MDIFLKIEVKYIHLICIVNFIKGLLTFKGIDILGNKLIDILAKSYMKRLIVLYYAKLS